MSENLMELCGEYERSLIIQQDVIAKNRAKLNAARAKANYKEVKRLNSLLKILYEEKTELERAAHDIKKYYS